MEVPTVATEVVDYGSTNNGHDDTIEMETTAGYTKEELHSHTMSTLALCTSVFSMMFILVSTFPYSGFMAIHLVPGLTPNSAGTYAGILSGSYMIGRVFSAWPLGVMCDAYGRKFVLLFSSLSNAFFVLAFGFSSTFRRAIAIRFLTGMCNGTMVAARVSATELAKGDRDLEARGMGMVMSMIGLSMLVGPAIGGILSEPVTQHPNIDFGVMENMLLEYPFVLPNVVGALFCIVSTIQVALSVEEMLPVEKLRSSKHIIPDLLQYLAAMPTNLMSFLRVCRNNKYGNVGTTTMEESFHNGKEGEETASIKEDFRIVDIHFGGVEDSLTMSDRSSQASFTSAPNRPCALGKASIPRNTQRIVSRNSTMSSCISHDIISLIQDNRVRKCLSCYWVTTLASTAAGECFPLFAMAKDGGLGIEETSIGLIGAGSGLLFILCQYSIFSTSMKRLGLHKTMVSSCLLAVPPAALIPISLLFKARPTAVITYLSVLNGVRLIAFSNWNAALTITQNRAVEQSSRARLNALAAIGGSLARGGGPILAGTLVVFSYTSGVVPTQFGSLVVYSVVSALGVAAFTMTVKLKDEDRTEVNES